MERGIEYRRIKQEYVKCMGLKVWVSTTFLGLDLDLTTLPMKPRSDPLVFETMVFGPCEWNQHDWRYRFWDTAEANHEEIMDMVRFSGWWLTAFDDWFKKLLVEWEFRLKSYL